MNYVRILVDAIVLMCLLFGASRMRSTFLAIQRYIGYTAGLIFMTLEDYFIYRHQENSDLFFWHPYIVWTISNLVFLIIELIKKKQPKKQVLMERLLLNQVVVNTVFAGVSLTVGWLMKLYIR